LKKLNIISEIPTIVAVQSEGSDAIARAFETGKFTPVAAKTVADSIAVDIPRNGYYALKQLQQYNGRCLTVSDDAILSAQKELSSVAGLFAEPAAAAAYAGFLKMKAELPTDSTVVLLITGSGLKDIDAAMTKIEFPSKSITSLEELE